MKAVHKAILIFVLHCSEPWMRRGWSGIGGASGGLVNIMVQKRVGGIFTNIAFSFGAVQRSAAKVARTLSVIKVLYDTS